MEHKPGQKSLTHVKGFMANKTYVSIRNPYKAFIQVIQELM